MVQRLVKNLIRWCRSRKKNRIPTISQKTTVGWQRDEKGFILVDNNFRAIENNVYAAGDCIGGAMLAHKASEEGIKIVEQIALGRNNKGFHQTNVPWIIYTWPEIAWVGKTEQECILEGQKVKSGKFPFIASGRSHAMGETEKDLSRLLRMLRQI